jgi:hypothetical protein
MKLPTMKKVAADCEQNGREHAIYMAVYSRKGVQLAAVYGTCDRQHAKDVSQKIIGFMGVDKRKGRR